MSVTWGPVAESQTVTRWDGFKYSKLPPYLAAVLNKASFEDVSQKIVPQENFVMLDVFPTNATMLDPQERRISDAPLFQVEFYNDHIRVRREPVSQDWLLLNTLMEFCSFLYDVDPFEEGVETRERFDRLYDTPANQWRSITMRHRISELHPKSPWASLQDPYVSAPSSSNRLWSPEEEAREHMRERVRAVDLGMRDGGYIPANQHASTQVNTYAW